jgi:hypothetical protein
MVMVWDKDLIKLDCCWIDEVVGDCRSGLNSGLSSSSLFLCWIKPRQVIHLPRLESRIAELHRALETSLFCWISAQQHASYRQNVVVVEEESDDASARYLG